MKILVFSSLNLDYDYTLDHIAMPKETTFANTFEIAAGGKGLNASIAIAKTGSHVYLAGCIGNNAKILEDMLEQYHVDTTLLNHLDEPNGHAIIQVDKNGENSIFIYGGSNQKVTTEYVDQVLANFEAGDILILQNEINNNAYIMSKAHEIGMTILLNPSPCSDSLKQLPLNYVDYFFINEVEGNWFTGKTDPDEILKAMTTTYPGCKVILTLGSEGSCFFDGTTKVSQPAVKINAVDTVGAGDTFMGYFTYGLANNHKISQILETASKAAAITCTRKGAAIAIPTIDEVKGLC